MLKTTLAAAALLIAAPAYAGDFSFNYKNHELETAGGAEQMFHRLESRVTNYCVSPGRKPISMKNTEDECVDQTLEDAVEQINDPRLNRVYAKNTGAADYAESESQSNY